MSRLGWQDIDTFHDRFVRLVPNEQLVGVVDFDTEDPALCGEMTMAITLAHPTAAQADASDSRLCQPVTAILAGRSDPKGRRRETPEFAMRTQSIAESYSNKRWAARGSPDASILFVQQLTRR